MRIVFAFIFAPALLPLIYLGYLSFAGVPTATDADITIGAVVPLSYVTMLVLGLPAVLALRWSNAGSLTAYLISGLLIAAVAQLAYFDSMVSNWHLWWGTVQGQIALGLVHTVGGTSSWWLYGAATGGLFWLIARPDVQSNRPRHGLVYGPHRTVS